MPRPEEKRLEKVIRSIFNSTFNSEGRFRLAMEDFHNRLNVAMDSFEGDNATEGTGGSVRECFPLLDQLTNMLNNDRKCLEASLTDYEMKNAA
jgi:hypothetical protein